MLQQSKTRGDEDLITLMRAGLGPVAVRGVRGGVILPAYSQVLFRRRETKLFAAVPFL